MKEKYDSCKNENHVYRENVCTLCGYVSTDPSKVIHGRYVCEECVEYVCSGEYENEPPKKIRKSRDQGKKAQKKS